MYGLVNQGIKDLILNQFGADKWESVCSEAQAPQDFISMQYYDDAITYRLVGAASKVLNVPAIDVLKEFGSFWVKYTGHVGYGPIMDLFGADFKSCIKNLNHLHTRMGMSLPQLNPPNFKFEEINEKEFHLHYYSERKGLEPMVQGLMHGLANKFGIYITIEQIGEEKENNRIFHVRILG